MTDDDDEPNTSVEVMTAQDGAPAPAGIPPAVWSDICAAGAAAARRLRHLLEHGTAWTKLPATTQARLIELALTRAYGAPVAKTLSLSLSSSDADAVAASLAGFAASLPEHGPRPARPETINPGGRRRREP
jgi:hypothetical protein